METGSFWQNHGGQNNGGAGGEIDKMMVGKIMGRCRRAVGQMMGGAGF